MNRNFFIVIVSLSIACMFLIFFTMLWEIDTPLQKEPAKQPPRSPYKTYISGVGIIEPSSESIYVGTPVNRIVIDVPVKVGEKVKKGDVLLRLDNRDLQANLKVQEAAYRSALAKLQKLKSFPRP